MGVNHEQIKVRLIELVEQMTEQTIDSGCLDVPLDELGVDSLMALELAVYLEREFGIRLSEEELNSIKTLNDILLFARDKES